MRPLHRVGFAKRTPKIADALQSCRSALQFLRVMAGCLDAHLTAMREASAEASEPGQQRARKGLREIPDSGRRHTGRQRHMPPMMGRPSGQLVEPSSVAYSPSAASISSLPLTRPPSCVGGMPRETLSFTTSSALSPSLRGAGTGASWTHRIRCATFRLQSRAAWREAAKGGSVDFSGPSTASQSLGYLRCRQSWLTCSLRRRLAEAAKGWHAAPLRCSLSQKHRVLLPFVQAKRALLEGSCPKRQDAFGRP